MSFFSVKTNGHGTDSYLEAIARGIATDNAARIVVVVVDSSDSSRYVAIKKQCCIGDHPSAFFSFVRVTTS